MDNGCYMISRAAQIVHEEEYVLRYWEKELELSIPRNEAGHRYYTKDNLCEFQRIKEYKRQGYSLKVIKQLLQREAGKEEEMTQLSKTKGQEGIAVTNYKLEQFQQMMTEIIGQAMEENNAKLGREISVQVGEKVIKEMNYAFRMQEEMEEERYRKLDETIREVQKRRLAKKEKENTKKRLFGKNGQKVAGEFV